MTCKKDVAIVREICRKKYFQNAAGVEVLIVTKEAIDSTDVKLNNVKILSAKPSNKKLVDAAISYIESLRELILTEGGYSQLADSLSLDEAQEIDRLFSRSSQKAQQAYIKYSSLLEPSPVK